jgi:hypothetical protein
MSKSLFKRRCNNSPHEIPRGRSVPGSAGLGAGLRSGPAAQEI